tara:strand:- start:10224 stop:10643 length:420 start_codon:yes stop_codon:yes gene_type:complete
MKTLGLFEVLEEAVKQGTTPKKVAFLQQHDSFALRTILQGCYHPNVKFLLPDSVPPYSETDGSQVETRLLNMAKKLDIFIEGGRDVKSQSQREMLFIEMLESIHPSDSKILLNMIQKKNPVKGITKTIAKKAFPSILPE